MSEHEHQFFTELNEFLCSTSLSRIIDLTHFLDKNIPSWDGGCGFHREMKCTRSRGWGGRS